MNSLSGWVREMVHHVYQTADGEVLPLPNVRTHEVCALEDLLAFSGSVDTAVILSASHLTFSDFHFWEIALLTGDLHCLGPTRAAQHSSYSKTLKLGWISWQYCVLYLCYLA